MSKISISAAVSTDSLAAAQLLHNMLGLSLSSVRARLRNGKTGIFYTTELFLNDHLEKDAQIRTLISGLQKCGVELFVVEIPHDMPWQAVADLDAYRITPKELLILLDEAKDKYL